MSGLVPLLLAGCAASRPAVIRQSAWEYRVDGGSWGVDMPALGPTVAWPKHWRTFTPWQYEAGTPPRNDDPASFTNAPLAVTLNGVSACRGSLPLYARGVLDVTVGQGSPQPGLWAYAFGTVDSPIDQDVSLRVRACGPLTLWLGGRKVLDAKRAGLHSVPAGLRKGRQVWIERGPLPDGPVEKAPDLSQFKPVPADAFVAGKAAVDRESYNVPQPVASYGLSPKVLFGDDKAGRGLFYAVWDNRRSVIVELECPKGARLWLSGREVFDGETIRLAPGLYPLLFEVRADVPAPAMPAFRAVSDKAADLAAWQRRVRANEALLRLIAGSGPQGAYAREVLDALED